MKRIVGAGFLVVLAAGLARWYVTSSQATSQNLIGQVKTPDQVLDGRDSAEFEGQIRTFCTQCHGFPEPSLFPKDVWPGEIDRAYRFHRESGRTDVAEPDSRAVVAWYFKHAEPKPPSDAPPITDPDTVFQLGRSSPLLGTSAAISCVTLVEGDDGQKLVLTTDMISGRVARTRLSLHAMDDQEIHRAANPARIRVCDLDPKSPEEYLVSELGNSGPTDATTGKVTWLRRDAEGAFSGTVIATNLGRVADARAADLDGDGDQDVIVAEFGWKKSGSVIILENKDSTFEKRTIDKRHGAVEIQIADLNSDGQLDFLIAFGQEYESIELFSNQGGLNFGVRQLFRHTNPAFGMSGLELFDNDNDGDLDILFTSGDAYDTFQIHDHHGVYMLVNRDGKFPVQRIGQQYAVHCAKPADVDGDGDIDFVASTFIPSDSRYAESKSYPALVLYECTEGGNYTSRILKSSDYSHATFAIGDVEDDVDMDLVVGTMHDLGGSSEPGFRIWENKGKQR